MQTALNDRSYQVSAGPELASWQHDIHNRIQVWYANLPFGEDMDNYSKKDLENFELSFHRALLYLYKPSPNIPEPAEHCLLIVADSANHIIRLYRQFFLERRLTIYWQAIENMSSAGTALMFSWVNTPIVQARITSSDLESLVNTCSSVLWGMVEHFPAFKAKRDAFDVIASRTSADISSSWSKRAKDLQGRLKATGPSSSVTNINSLVDNGVQREPKPTSDPRYDSSRHPSIQPQEVVADSENLGSDPVLHTNYDDGLSFIDWTAIRDLDDFFTPSWI